MAYRVEDVFIDSMLLMDGSLRGFDDFAVLVAIRRRDQRATENTEYIVRRLQQKFSKISSQGKWVRLCCLIRTPNLKTRRRLSLVSLPCRSAMFSTWMAKAICALRRYIRMVPALFRWLPMFKARTVVLLRGGLDVQSLCHIR